ncbi:MAG: acyl--CoA ligase [Gemmatimonadales bacterium]
MAVAETIPDLLGLGRGDDPALLAPGRDPLTYAALREQVARTTAVLQARGLGRGDRVAIVLPNGPELAAAFLSIATGATAAPLNPALSAIELEFALRDFGIRAVVVPEGSDAPVRRIAASLGVAVLELRTTDARPAGWFELADTGEPAPPPTAPVRDDVALVLHTSGTTARPKIVPLRHRNLVASADHIRETLRLGPHDRGLNIMPLFHVHGLAACLLAPLSAGGSIYCTAGFNPLRFFSELTDARATWYSAVPTMHQAILARAAGNADRVAATPLRFIRSSSSALPPSVCLELESVFGVPVIQAYGMTEAAHQVASNPLPPGATQPGSVGPAAGPDVAIMDERGTLLPPRSVGEIVIRGPNVFDGYEARPTVNAESFVDGWFRTGDQGVIDAAGYLTITSRIKEIINRGGEKISPREIDEVLLEHPAVRLAVAFSVPHPLLGEDVGAAVVLKEGTEATEQEILGFVRRRVAPFKVPATLRILAELPSSATGKVKRLDMARLLGLG